MNERSKSRSAARLAAVQALYQLEMEGTPIQVLLHEFHQHRLGATIEDVTYTPAEESFFDDIVAGVDKRRDE
ncbi:MAG: transcription antitermination factor NusB, partial [bacterium]|nr:transcription antitermination factor NusB [bacterium]